MTNINTTDNMQINETEIDKVTNYKCLGQAITMKNKTRRFDQNKSRTKSRIKAGWSVFGNYTGTFP